MQQLRADTGIERCRPFLDHAKTKVHVTEEPALVRRTEHWATAELAHTADVVNERSRDEQIHAQPLMKLCRLARQGCDADGVLEQSACVGVMRVHGRRKRAHRCPRLRVEHVVDRRAKAGVRDLGGEELEEAFELVRISAHRGRHRRRIDVLRGLERPNVELQTVAESLDASEHAHGIALAEARVEKLDVVPHACCDPPARVDELEREIRSAVLASAAAPSSRPHRRPRPCGSPRAARSPSLEGDHRADPVLRLHELEAVVDLVE